MLGIILGLAAGIFSGALLIFAMPPYGVWHLALFAFVPILFYRVRFGFRFGWVGSATFSLIMAFYFARWYFDLMGGGIGGFFTALVSILGFALLYFTVLEIAVWVSWRRPAFMPFALPVLWTSFDIIRTALPGIQLAWFPLIANSQVNNLALLQNASVAGIAVVTFLLLLVNAVISYIIVNPFWAPRYIWGSLVIAGPIALWIISLVGLNNYETFSESEIEPLPEVVLVQGWRDVDQTPEEYILNNLKHTSSGTIIVFPEIFLGDFSDEDFDRFLRDTATNTDTYIVMQGPETIGDKYYNSAALYSPDGEMLIKYHKQFMPPGDNCTKGRGLTHREGVNDIGLMICYDTHFESAPLQQTREGVHYFFVPSNDAGYGDDFFHQIHFNNHIFRAVENRAYIFVAAVDGITGAIDPTGQVIATLDMGDENERLTIQPQHKFALTSFYAKYPYIFPILMFIGSFIILVAGATSIRSRWRESSKRPVRNGEQSEQELASEVEARRRIKLDNDI